MATAIQVWSLPLPAGQKVKLTAVGDIRITNAALDAELADEKARSAVRLTYKSIASVPGEDDDEEEEVSETSVNTVLCALTPGKIEQASLDIVITEEDEFVFENLGKNLIHLSGNYIEQHQDEAPSDFDSDEEDDEAYPLQDVSSDVEIDPRELELLDDDDEEDSSRFEEVKDEAESKSNKRPRESDAMEVEGEKKLSKKEKKSLKKQKAEDGKAITTSETNGDEKEPKEKKDKKEKKETKSEMKELASGLKIQDMTVGTGKAAKSGNTVSMRYIGKFTDGKVFDKNVKGKPFSFKLGAGEVIKGWDEGIAGMQPGGERLLIVPPKLGYGNRKIDGIPAGSTLRFECKLLEVK